MSTRIVFADIIAFIFIWILLAILIVIILDWLGKALEQYHRDNPK